MADLDLSIVVRARDLLTAELKRMGTSLQEIGRIGRAAFAQVDAGQVTASVRSTEAAIRSLGASNASLRPLEQDLSESRVRLDSMREAATRAGGEITQLDRQKLDGFEREVREGEAALTRFKASGERAAVGFSTSFRAAGAAVKSALLPVLPLLTLGGAAFAAADSVRQAAEFEKALAGISAQAGITGASLDGLKARALETTRALGISELKAAPALLSAITDGAKDAAEGLAIFDASARLATASSADLAKTTDVLTSVTNAYRDAGLDAAEAADVLFTSARAGKLDIDELAGGIDAILPLASNLGVSFEELAALIVATTKSGGGFEQGMQAVRTTLGGLTRENAAAAIELRGLDFSSAAIRARGLVPVLQDVSERLDGNAEAIRRVFPDARSFGVVMALLKDDGAALASALEQVSGSAGSVRDALGRKLQSPAEQLGVVVNRLRSEFADAFGGAFFASVGRAIEEMGGMEKASERVGSTAREIGEAFGTALPPAIEILKELAQATAEFSKALDSVGFEQFSKVAVVAVRSVAESLGTVADLMGAFGEFTFGGFDFTLLSDRVKAEIAELKGDLDAIFEEPRTVEVRARGLDEVSGLFAIAQEQAADFGFALEKLPPRLHEALGIFKASGDAEPLKAVVAEMQTFRQGVDDATASMNELDVELLGLRKARIVEIGTELTTLEANVKRATDQAKELEIIDPAQVDAFLAANGLILSEIEKRKAALIAERTELQGFVSEEAVVKTRIETPDPRTIGFAIQSALDAALELVDPGAVSRLTDAIKEAVERGDTITAEALFSRREQNELRLRARRAASDVVGEFSTFEDAADLIRDSFDVPPGAANFKELLRDEAIEGHALVDVLASLLVSRGRDVRSLADVRRALLEVSDAQVDAARSARGAEVEAKRYLQAVTALPSSATTEIIAFGIEAALAGLDQLARELDVLEGQAIALGIEIGGLSPEQARDAIDNARAQIERDSLAISIGLDVKVDDRTLAQAVEEAQAAVERATAEAGRAGLEREAIHFGLSVDSSTLEADIVRARDQAQAAADALGAFNRESEAIVLGIEIAGKSPAELEHEIAQVQANLQRFAAEHPIAFTAINSAASGLADAFADIVSGTQDADEALRQLAQSFLRDIAQMIAQQAIFNALRAAGFGSGDAPGAATIAASSATAAATLTTAGTVTGAAISAGATAAAATLISAATTAASIIAASSAVSIVGARGLVFPAARGVVYGDEPDMAVRYALGGVPDQVRNVWTEVHPFAAGGVPDVSRQAHTSAVPFGLGGTPDAYRSLFTDVVPFEAGGVPDLAGQVRYAFGGFPDLAKPDEVAVAIRYALGGLPEIDPDPVTVPVRYAAGGSPYLDRIVDRPTLASSASFRGSAIVPLSGGGVATPDGSKLPLEREPSGELVVRRMARGGFDVLFGEAGPEATMRAYRGPGGRLGLRASDGEVLPFTRVQGGRLGVVPYARGGLPAGGGAAPGQQESVQLSMSLAVSVQDTSRAVDRRQELVAALNDPRTREQLEGVFLEAIRRSGTIRSEVRGDRVS